MPFADPMAIEAPEAFGIILGGQVPRATGSPPVVFVMQLFLRPFMGVACIRGAQAAYSGWLAADASLANRVRSGTKQP